mmetsp:Transcript_21881/g.58338  ORF Transcript_21881/g.58338 Transcript_21881/m.58338 type:complete len:342 (+) Transcript_21881:1093-2118(+)
MPSLQLHQNPHDNHRQHIQHDEDDHRQQSFNEPDNGLGPVEDGAEPRECGGVGEALQIREAHDCSDDAAPEDDKEEHHPPRDRGEHGRHARLHRNPRPVHGIRLPCEIAEEQRRGRPDLQLRGRGRRRLARKDHHGTEPRRKRLARLLRVPDLLGQPILLALPVLDRVHLFHAAAGAARRRAVLRATLRGAFRGGELVFETFALGDSLPVEFLHVEDLGAVLDVVHVEDLAGEDAVKVVVHGLGVGVVRGEVHADDRVGGGPVLLAVCDAAGGKFGVELGHRGDDDGRQNNIDDGRCPVPGGLRGDVGHRNDVEASHVRRVVLRQVLVPRRRVHRIQHGGG